MDLHESGGKLLTSLGKLEKDIVDAKDGIINPTLGRNLSTTIRQIHSLYDLIEKKSFLLDGKTQFQVFLIGMLNEIFTTYADIFDFLVEKISSIEKGINIESLDEKQKSYLLHIIKPILERRKGELEKMKEIILSKKIV
jgi:hypothetical protein